MKLITNALDYYIDTEGNVFRKQKDGTFYKKKNYIEPRTGYAFCGIKIKGKMRNKRVHRLVAQTYLPNPNNKPSVNHINGVKHDNRLSNLEWATISENTNHAYRYGFAQNASGYEDSQSYPVSMYNLDGELIANFGSITEASKNTKIPKNTIARHCKKKIVPRKHKFYFRYQTEVKRLSKP